MRRARGVALAALTALAAAALPAQGGRHELGLRLRAFERHLAEVPDPARRDAAFVELERAVQAFFRLDMASVAAAVDAADVALAGAEASADERFARSLQLQLGRRLVDAGSAQLQIEVSQLYEADARQQLTFAWRVHDDAPWQRRPIAAVPFEIERELRDLPVGDHTFAWRIERDQQPVLARSMAFAAVADLDARLERVFAAAATARKITPKSIESATLPALANLLRTTLRRSAYETELAGRALLLEAERLVGWLDDSREQHRYHGQRPGSFRLRVPTGRRTVAARLFAPAVDQGRRPIVVALHGAGGSENLFFDGYGDGLCVELARRRGWFVVSPRNGMGFVDIASLVDALAERYPIDRERVFVVGHSMGAVQTMQNVSRRPDRFRAAAPIAGGGSVRASQAFARLPFFVCAGERDFGLGGARRLHRAIEAAGATASFRVDPAVEHLAIVQVALPDVFAFFDEHAK
ncbi:MAG: prolyl oligopeptidase family serine peptidase [Planctomycetota bacterium]